LVYTPAYNTTRALCQNTAHGIPIHYGISCTLRPVMDFEAILQSKVSEFLDLSDNNFLELESESRENFIFDRDLTVDFLKDQIKQNVGKQFSQYLTKIIVKSPKINGRHWQTIVETV